MLSVGIIDTGLNVEELSAVPKHLDGVCLHQGRNGRIHQSDDMRDHFKHGTVCVDIIQTLVPDVQLFIVKIFSQNQYPTVSVLSSALETCLSKKVNLINISLGIQSEIYPYVLLEACEKAHRAGIPILAAAHNDGRVSYPAFDRQVITVGHFPLKGPTDLLFMPNEPVNFFLNGDYVFNKLKFTGSSFACPKLSALSIRCMQSSGTVLANPLRSALIEKAVSRRLPDHLSKSGFLAPEWSALKASLQRMHPLSFLGWLNQHGPINKIMVLPLYDDYGLLFKESDFPRRWGPYSVFLSKVDYTEDKLPVLFPEVSDVDFFDTVLTGALQPVINVSNNRFLITQFSALLKREKTFVVFDDFTYRFLSGLSAELKSGRVLLYEDRQGIPANGQEAIEKVTVRGVPRYGLVSSAVEDVHGRLIDLSRWASEAGHKASTLGAFTQAELLGIDHSLPVGHPGFLQLPLNDQYRIIQGIFNRVLLSSQPDLVLSAMPGGFANPNYSSGSLNRMQWLALLDSQRLDGVVVVYDQLRDTPESITTLLHAVESVLKLPVLCFFQVNEAGGEETRHRWSARAPVINGPTPQAASQWQNVLRRCIKK